MNEGPNKLVRVLLPLVLLVVAGGGIAVAVFRNASGVGSPSTAFPAQPALPTAAAPTAAKPPQAQSPLPVPAAIPADTTAPAAKESSPPTPPSSQAAQPESAGKAQPAATVAVPAPGPPAGPLKAQIFPLGIFEPLGSLTPKSKSGSYEMELRFSELGAGIEQLQLANHFTTIKRDIPDTLQARTFLPVPNPDGSPQRVGLVAFAVDAIEVDGQRISLWLAAKDQSFWRQVGQGRFEAFILDSNDQPQLKLTRHYIIAPGAYEFTIQQSIENLSSAKHNVRFIQYGPKELPLPTARYGGDVRRVRFGHTLPPKMDPDQPVLSNDSRSTLISHADVLGKADGTLNAFGTSRWNAKALWPTPDATKNDYTLVWAATTNRYFTIAVQPTLPAGATPTKGSTIGSPRPTLIKAVESIDRMAIATPAEAQGTTAGGVIALRLSSPILTLEPAGAPGSAADLSVGVYAGPSSARTLESQPNSHWSELQNIVIYTFGGPCGFCTFQPVANFLRWFLGKLHDIIFHDWSLAIMFLVVCVRTLLHPVTRWSQVNMLRFSKRMGKMSPEMKKIQEKYKDDRVKLQQEQARLMQEHGGSFGVGAMGCLPALLQTPVWIALYAMLFFTFELRHEPAFYGIVQSLTGNKWGFMGDLAEPDHLIGFGTSFWIPLLSNLMGPIEGLNILPLALGVVFFIQQKYMTPPTTTPLTPEQETQQKIAKWMMVIMFPLFMYNAASGLALYFLTNSTLSILETKWIRSRSEKMVEAEELARDARRQRRQTEPFQPKEGFLARMQRMAMEQQKIREQQAKDKAKAASKQQRKGK